MYLLPHTTMGRRALWLLVPVLLYPLWWQVLRLIPDSWRALSIAIVFAVILLAVVSLVVAGVAIFREKDRSVLLVAIAAVIFLQVVVLAVGEALGGH